MQGYSTEPPHGTQGICRGGSSAQDRSYITRAHSSVQQRVMATIVNFGGERVRSDGGGESWVGSCSPGGRKLGHST